jgi:hypothetical protein
VSAQIEFNRNINGFRGQGRAGCTAVGGHVNGSDAANLAQSDMGTSDAEPAVRDHGRPAKLGDRPGDAGYDRQLNVLDSSGPLSKNKRGRRSGAIATERGSASNDRPR